MFAGLLLDKTLVLYQFVFLAEADVGVSVKLCDMLRKVSDAHRFLDFIGNRAFGLEIYVGQRVRLIGIVEIVVVALDASSRRVKWLN